MRTTGIKAQDEVLLALHTTALSLLDGVLMGLTSDDLSRPTPCRIWDVGQLLAHVAGQNAGLSESAAGGGQEARAWQFRAIGADPAVTVARSAQQLAAALAATGPEGEMWMPEISAAKPLPSRVAVRAHLLDTVVHAWDLAVALSKLLGIPDELLREVMLTAVMIPGGGRSQQGAAFGPALEPRAGAADLEKLLRHLGRNPRWLLPSDQS